MIYFLFRLCSFSPLYRSFNSDSGCLLLITSMKYIALLSGGKDSCYNLLHCAKNGHELVAAASLGPGQGKGPTKTVIILHRT